MTEKNRTYQIFIFQKTPMTFFIFSQIKSFHNPYLGHPVINTHNQSILRARMSQEYSQPHHTYAVE